MRVIGVIDLAGGRAVHAQGGSRANYLPVQSVAGATIDGDPLLLARAYVERFGLAELYAADLEAIEAGASGDAHAAGDEGRLAHDTIIRDLAAIAPLWLDAAVSSPEEARHVLALGAVRAVVGLETLGSFDALAEICAAVGSDQVVFSLDLRNGNPIAPRLGISPGEPAHQLAARAADAGVGAVIVLDLARVGAATGPDVELMARVRAAVPDALLIAAGGVRDGDDLARLADTGCDGALVATALHHGRLGSLDVGSRCHTRGSL
jgi:phosphoribosylformimino-5-aminoimidazole carboxamide ribotide isomerase